MILYRIEQQEYDYSPTIGVFDSLNEAEDYLKQLGAVCTPSEYGDYWELRKVVGTRKKDHISADTIHIYELQTFVVYELELNVPGERRL